MANQEHLDILKQGVKIWNQWREEHPEVKPDLSEAHLHGAKLVDANLSKTDLHHAHLDEADLSYAHLNEANLVEASLVEANLSYVDLIEANLREADLRNAEVTIAEMWNADLREADLSGANLSRTELYGVDLWKANLSGANLSEAALSNADLSNANLSGATLNNAGLGGVDLSDTNLSGANLHSANLIRARFINTHLQSTNFSEAYVAQTIFGNVDLRTAKGLEMIIHQAPSTLGFDTISRSQGNIPDVFLVGVGLTNNQINYVHSLVNNLHDYYTCFISYSSDDHSFADHLYADLQSKGVRCWFAPEDMRIGDHIHARIDESIKRYDKLLLVLSEHALASTWVEREVATALEKEQQQGQRVLFPIRLDDTVMQTSQAWAADIRRRKHIGDFTKWKQHDDYQQALDRLLRDLKAEENA